MLLHHQNLTPGDAEYQKLMSAHKAEMEALERNLNSEKDRQKEALRKKVRVKVVFVVLKKVMSKNNTSSYYRVLARLSMMSHNEVFPSILTLILIANSNIKM